MEVAAPAMMPLIFLVGLGAIVAIVILVLLYVLLTRNSDRKPRFSLVQLIAAVFFVGALLGLVTQALQISQLHMDLERANAENARLREDLAAHKASKR